MREAEGEYKMSHLSQDRRCLIANNAEKYGSNSDPAGNRSNTSAFGIKRDDIVNNSSLSMFSTPRKGGTLQ